MARIGQFNGRSLHNIGLKPPVVQYITEKVSSTSIALTSGFSLSSSVTKFGATSIYSNGSSPFGQGLIFDGTGKTLGNYAGTSGFTVEGWFYPTSVTGNHTFARLYDSAGQSILGYHTADTTVWSYITTTGNVSSQQVNNTPTAGYIVANTWNWFCYTQVGRSGWLWWNGVYAGTDISNSYLSTQNNVHRTLEVGGSYQGAFTGYFDDIRVSSGSRYGPSDNLNPPTGKFTVDGTTLALIGT
jgi:hypothetical protein